MIMSNLVNSETGRALQAESSERQWLVLRFCIRPLGGADRSWPSWISARVRLILRPALEGQTGHQITNATARPFSILQIQLAVLGGDLIQFALGLTEALTSVP